MCVVMSHRGEQPVVIAGGGVVGITLALLLARRRVPTVVLEQALEPQTLPRAHAVNPRTIEILAAELGIGAERGRAVAAPKELTSEVRFVTTLTGHCFGTVPYERQDDDVLAVTPAPLLNVPRSRRSSRSCCTGSRPSRSSTSGAATGGSGCSRATGASRRPSTPGLQDLRARVPVPGGVRRRRQRRARDARHPDVRRG